MKKKIFKDAAVLTFAGLLIGVGLMGLSCRHAAKKAGAICNG